MSIKTSIGWTDMTLNPIKGQCKGGCWYCWTKPLYRRKFLNPEIRLDLAVFDKLPKKPKKIFLCSTHDLFGGWVLEKWVDYIIEKVKQWPQHTFQILTKFPEHIFKPMPNNVWLGVTVEDASKLGRIIKLIYRDAKIKFVSFEPLFFSKGRNHINRREFLLHITKEVNWVIIGRLTGFGKIYDPPKWLIEDIVRHCKQLGIPIFLKENLKEIWGKSNLIQEFPSGR